MTRVSVIRKREPVMLDFRAAQFAGELRVQLMKCCTGIAEHAIDRRCQNSSVTFSQWPSRAAASARTHSGSSLNRSRQPVQQTQ